MDDALKSFGEKILSINPRYTNFAGRGMPGMGGTSMATAGAANSGTEVTLELQHETAAFLGMCADPQLSKIQVEQKARVVERLILTEETLSVVNTEQANSLIDELYELVEKR